MGTGNLNLKTVKKAENAYKSQTIDFHYTSSAYAMAPGVGAHATFNVIGHAKIKKSGTRSWNLCVVVFLRLSKGRRVYFTGVVCPVIDGIPSNERVILVKAASLTSDFLCYETQNPISLPKTGRIDLNIFIQPSYIETNGVAPALNRYKRISIFDPSLKKVKPRAIKVKPWPPLTFGGSV